VDKSTRTSVPTSATRTTARGSAMSLFFDFMVVLSSSLPFSEAWKRVRCLRKNHINDIRPTLIQKQKFEKHPQTDYSMVYTVNLMQCNHCSLNYLDSGFEFRKYHE
jgi:hypothetical protein